MSLRLFPVVPAVFVLLMTGCATVGPSAIGHGRSTYNAVINRTEDEQILSMIVRQRYDETFGILAVSGVTASLRANASIGVNLGFGPIRGYEGQLVPFSAEGVYEENPTISYVPLRGEQFLQRMLAPVSAEQALLLSRMSTREIEVLRLLVRRANGLANPLYAAGPADERFNRFATLYSGLRDAGNLNVVQSKDGEFALFLHGFAKDQTAQIDELLRTLGVEVQRPLAAPISIPLRFYLGSPRADGIDFETPSPLELIRAAAAGVEVPGEHLSSGLAQPVTVASPHALVKIQSSVNRPRDASVAVRHRDHWFFVDARDNRSKQGFSFLRTLIGIRLDNALPGQGTPVLTVPVSR